MPSQLVQGQGTTSPIITAPPRDQSRTGSTARKVVVISMPLPAGAAGDQAARDTLYQAAAREVRAQRGAGTGDLIIRESSRLVVEDGSCRRIVDSAELLVLNEITRHQPTRAESQTTAASGTPRLRHR